MLSAVCQLEAALCAVPSGKCMDMGQFQVLICRGSSLKSSSLPAALSFWGTILSFVLKGIAMRQAKEDVQAATVLSPSSSHQVSAILSSRW